VVDGTDGIAAFDGFGEAGGSEPTAAACPAGKLIVGFRASTMLARCTAAPVYLSGIVHSSAVACTGASCL
jgi:hypothetical protein